MSTDLFAALKKAKSFVETHDLQSALMIYAAIVEQWPDNEEALTAFETIAFEMSKEHSAQEPTQQQIDQIMTLSDQRQLPLAIKQGVELLKEFPRSVHLHMLVARIAFDLDAPEIAVQSLSEVTKLDPFFAEGFYYLGRALKQANKLGESASAFTAALLLRPDYVSAYCDLGAVLMEQKRFDDAIDSFQKAIEIEPDCFDAYNNLGLALSYEGKPKESIACLGRAVQLRPSSAVPHANLGIVYSTLGQVDESMSSYQLAYMIDPTLVENCTNLGTLLNGAEAIAMLRKAVSLDPYYAEAYNNLGDCLRSLGQDLEALDNYSRAIELKPDYLEAYNNRQYCMSVMENVSPTEQLASAKHFGKVIASKVGALFTSWPVKSTSDKLVVGFVSGDFRRHPVGFALDGLVAAIDQSKFELVAFNNNYLEDTLTARIKPHFSKWVKILGQNDQSTAQLIQNHGVDILIDLSGHTAGNRLPLFAYKAAPVQVSWLGYWSTTGVAEIDYKLGDNFMTPPDQDEFFSESIWRLPNSFLCFAPPAVDLPVVPLPAASSGQVTFGCFNQYGKITDHVIVVWSKILSAIPGSRLVLKMSALSDETVVESARARFAVQGILGDQLVLEGGAPYEEYLARYHDIDIALDPFPYPGGATTIESLWMAVPVLTKQGGLLPLSRQGASLMHNAGLPDWVAEDDDDYIAKAIAFAGNIDRLIHLRAGLRRQVVASPLFDGQRFARDFEMAMQGMWAGHSG